jgi:hypothetical protein
VSVTLSRIDGEGSQNTTAGALWLRSSPPRSFVVFATQDDQGFLHRFSLKAIGLRARRSREDDDQESSGV